jgi:glutamine amidotransferase/cyclase
MLLGYHALPDVGDGLQVIACLDVRSNDAGDLVVTKGDQYDVREQTSDREVQTHTQAAKILEDVFVTSNQNHSLATG